MNLLIDKPDSEAARRLKRTIAEYRQPKCRKHLKAKGYLAGKPVVPTKGNWRQCL